MPIRVFPATDPGTGHKSFKNMIVTQKEPVVEAFEEVEEMAE